MKKFQTKPFLLLNFFTVLVIGVAISDIFSPCGATGRDQGTTRAAKADEDVEITIREAGHDTFHRIVFDVPPLSSPPRFRDLIHRQGHNDIHIFPVTQRLTACRVKKGAPNLIQTCAVVSLPAPQEPNATVRALKLTLKPGARHYKLKRRLLLPGKDGGRRYVVDVVKKAKVAPTRAPEPMPAHKGSVPPKTAPSRERGPSAIAQNKQLSTRSDLPSFERVDIARKPIRALLGFEPKVMLKPWRPVIVIDAGHGGRDPGSISCRNRPEKQVCLQAAWALYHHLKATQRYHVIMTRRGDYYIPKRQRFKIARQARADLFISVHADNHPNKNVRGLSIYTLSKVATDAEAARLAKQENQTEYAANFSVVDRDVSHALINLSQSESASSAYQVAQKLHANLCDAAFTPVMSLRAADLAVLKAPEVPSLLIELGFLSNTIDEKRIHDKTYHIKVAEQLEKALRAYFYQPRYTVADYQ